MHGECRLLLYSSLFDRHFMSCALCAAIWIALSGTVIMYNKYILSYFGALCLVLFLIKVVAACLSACLPCLPESSSCESSRWQLPAMPLSTYCAHRT